MVTQYNINYSLDKSVTNPSEQKIQTISVDALGPSIVSPVVFNSFDGEKYPGGMGPINIWLNDYWGMRQRSEQLFKENLYAKGLIRRLITNEINTGLFPESNPDSRILNTDSDQLTDWTEMVEARFDMWANSPTTCDYYNESTFGQLQQTARREALICGDVLVVLSQSQRTKMPQVRLIGGSRVRTPLLESPREGHTIRHGVELDTLGRVVAYWIAQDDFTYKRLPAYGERSGRRIAWLVYGTERRLDELRGEPLLSVVLQSLKEIDRYRDAVQRKAVINSILAMFIKKTADKPSALPLTGGAVRKDQVAAGTLQGQNRNFNIANALPGMVIEELQTGEEPVGFHSQGVDLSFPDFEAAIVHAIAWANEVPPEILTLAFKNNYSASQAAINEFKQYLNKVWIDFGQAFCTPIYCEWLVSEALLGKVTATGFLEAWGDPTKYDIFGAWSRVIWYGSIKPTTDMLKATRGAQVLVQEGWSTNAAEARKLTGTKFSDNIAWLGRENKAKANAMRPWLELSKEFGVPVEKIQALMNGTVSAQQGNTDNEQHISTEFDA